MVGITDMGALQMKPQKQVRMPGERAHRGKEWRTEPQRPPEFQVSKTGKGHPRWKGERRQCPMVRTVGERRQSSKTLGHKLTGQAKSWSGVTKFSKPKLVNAPLVGNFSRNVSSRIK